MQNKRTQIELGKTIVYKYTNRSRKLCRQTQLRKLIKSEVSNRASKPAKLNPKRRRKKQTPH